MATTTISNQSSSSTQCASTTSNTPLHLRNHNRTALSLKEQRKLKQNFRCTPWYNHDEYNHVGASLQLATQLFSPAGEEEQKDDDNDVNGDHYNDIANAIQRVSIWRKRNNGNNSSSHSSSSGRLPHYIDVTSSLAESLLQDATHSNDSVTTQTGAMTMRLCYASTIIRGVNGIADSMTRNRSRIFQIMTENNNNNTHPSMSVSNLCSKMGLPSWIVDIRHDASHQELPSLTMLRLGALTLLQFYLDVYWFDERCCTSYKSLEWKRIGLDYLKQWKKSLGVSTNNAQDVEEVEVRCGDNQNKNNNYHDDGDKNDNEKPAATYGAYSILMDIDVPSKKTKRKKSKKDLNKQTSKGKKDTKKHKSFPIQEQNMLQSCSNHSINSNHSNHELNTEELMTKFLNEIPMDLAYDLLVSYFIWGGVGDVPHHGRGIFIPGSIHSYPQNQEGIRKLRQKYGPTLVQICQVWTGFIPCLLVNIVDAILLLESELDTFAGTWKNDDNSDDGGDLIKQDDEEKFNKNKVDHDDNDVDIEFVPNDNQTAGHERKQFFLLSWVRYLLSNEFYLQLDWINETTKILIQSKKNQNSNKRKNHTPWSDDQLVVLESNASKGVLKYANLPLNSLCDRCEHYESTRIGSTTLTQMCSLFRSILGNERVVDHGIVLTRSKKWKRKFNNQQDKSLSIDNDNEVKKQPHDVPGEKKMMTLEDMERIVMSNDEIDRNEDCDTAHHEKAFMSWTQCTAWDECAIGSLPGHVS